MHDFKYLGFMVAYKGTEELDWENKIMSRRSLECVSVLHES